MIFKNSSPQCRIVKALKMVRIWQVLQSGLYTWFIAFWVKMYALFTKTILKIKKRPPSYIDFAIKKWSFCTPRLFPHATGPISFHQKWCRCAFRDGQELESWSKWCSIPHCSEALCLILSFKSTMFHGREIDLEHFWNRFWEDLLSPERDIFNLTNL